MTLLTCFYETYIFFLKVFAPSLESQDMTVSYKTTGQCIAAQSHKFLKTLHEL